MRHHLIFALVVLLAFTGSYTSAGSLADRTQVQMGVLDYESKQTLSTQWQDFEKVLSAQLPQYDFRIELFDHDALENAVASRNLDFVLTTSGNYLQLDHQYGLSSPLATIVRHHRNKPLRAYGGVIFARADNADIRNLEDLSDKRIATISTASFASYQMQAHTLMRDTGKAPTSEQLLVTGSPQTRVVEAVLQGRSDVGFVRSGVLESLAEQGKLDLRQIKILNSQSLPGYPFLTSTLLYPEWPVAAMPHTDRALTNLVAGVLLSLSREKSPVTQHIYGFDVPANYRTTERLLRDLKARPFDTPVKVTFDDIWATFKPHAIAIIIVAMILLASIVVFARLSRALASARDALEIEHQRLKNILWGTHAGTWEWDIDSGDVRFNERWAELIGYTLDELQPTSIDTWIKHTHPDDLVRSNELLQKIFDRKVPAYECEVRMKHKQGHWVWVLDRGKVVAWSSDGKPLKMAGTHTDITEKKNYEKKLERIATTDMLTGLPNRFALMDRLQLAKAIQRRHGGYLAIILLDLDGFKEINDSYGHDAGDQLLIQVAERFQRVVREEDTVARLGGDEFVVVLNGLKEANNCIPQVERLLDAASQPVISNGARLTVSASAGITIFPQKEDASHPALFRQADAAMYEAKKLGKNAYAFAEAVSSKIAKKTA